MTINRLFTIIKQFATFQQKCIQCSKTSILNSVSYQNQLHLNFFQLFVAFISDPSLTYLDDQRFICIIHASVVNIGPVLT